ncbi:MAG: hypothetical protein J0G28_14520 [Afipia sp.]|nr:hypothetical protein [Afipia sp.]OJW65513.1 MAG: hypothetical protein BGO65_12360 [Afipia sp. 64-13]
MAAPFLTPTLAFALTAGLRGPLRGYASLFYCPVTQQRFSLATIRRLTELRYYREHRSRAALTAEGRRVAMALAGVVAIIAAAQRSPNRIGVIS